MSNPTADFPQDIHESVDVPALGNQNLGSTSPKHTEVHGKLEEEIVAVQEKLGIGESNADDATTGQVLAKKSDGTTGWDDLDTKLDKTALGFVDWWNRADGSVGNGWLNAHTLDATAWDELEILNNTLVNPNPDTGPIATPGNSGARGVIYQDMEPHLGADAENNIHAHVELNGPYSEVGHGYPLLHIVPSTQAFGVGIVYEPGILGGTWVAWKVGKDPDDLAVIAAFNEPGVDVRAYDVYSDGTDIWAVHENETIIVAEIPAELVGSTLHGIGTDINEVEGRPANVQVFKNAVSFLPIDVEVSSVEYVNFSRQSVEQQIKEVIGSDGAYLQKWFPALSRAGSEPIDIVVVGDSIASLGFLGGENLAFPWKLGRIFSNQLLGLDPSDQWVFAKTDGNTPQMTSNAGSASGTGVGVGGWSSSLTNGQKATHTAVMDGITVVYTKQSGGGSLEVRDGVGGTLLTTISTSAASTKSSYMWTSDELTLQSHTIEITSVGNTILEGVYIHKGTRTSGVRVWAAAHGGWTTNNFTDANVALDMIENLQPDLVILATGTNDDVGSIDSRVRTLVNNVQSVTSNDILLWVPPIADNALGATFTSAEADLLRAIAVDENIATVDEAMLMGSIGTAGLTYDGLHPGTGGSQLIAEHIYNKIGADVLGSALGRLIKESTQEWKQAANSFIIGQLFGYGTFTIYGATSSDTNISLMPPVIAALLGYVGTTLSFGPSTGAVDVYLSRLAANRFTIGGTAGTSSSGSLAANISPSANTRTGTTYTLTLSDAGKLITRSNASASTQTLPSNASAAIPVDTQIHIINLGAGTVTFANDGTSTIQGIASITQNQRAIMTKIGTNAWHIA